MRLKKKFVPQKFYTPLPGFPMVRPLLLYIRKGATSDPVQRQ
jgi:hypothetical protein